MNTPMSERLKIAINTGTGIGLVATAIGLILTAVSIHQNTSHMAGTNQWNRSKYSLEIIELFSKYSEDRKALKAEFRELWSHAEFKALSEMSADTLFSDSAKAAIKHHVHQVLNYFELVSQTYESNVVDTNLIKESLGSVMKRTHEFFVPYIQCVAKEWQYEAWGPFYRLGWKLRGLPYKRYPGLESQMSRED